MPVASGWCHCRENHPDTRSCPGPLKQELDGKGASCSYCGTKHPKGAAQCRTVICNQCNGKRL